MSLDSMCKLANGKKSLDIHWKSPIKAATKFEN